MNSRVALLAFALAAALMSGPARAATTSISAFDFDYSPRGPQLAAGAPLSWRNDSFDDLHTVTAYYGAVFASGALNPFESFQTTYGGGTVLYRCLYYSTLDATVSPPRCSGMCGSLQPDTPDVAPPAATITTPNGFIFNGGVRINGSAVDNRAVSEITVTFRPMLVVPVVSPAKEAIARCTGCGQPNVLWTRSENPLNATLAPGVYSVTATARDAGGNTDDSPPITIYVLA